MQEICGVPAGGCGCEKSTAPRYAPLSGVDPRLGSVTALGVRGKSARAAAPVTHTVEPRSARADTASVEPPMSCDPRRLPETASTSEM